MGSINYQQPLLIKMTAEFSTILDSLLKLIGGAFGVKLFEYVLEKRREKKEARQKEDIVSNLKDISLMHSIMSDVVDNTAADRFIVFMGHDSGNIPNPKHPYYARAIWQRIKNDDDADSLIRKYDSIRVDYEYINMIIEVLTKGCVKINIDEMPECLLKTIYRSEGIKYAEIYFLAQEKSHKIYYCSIATKKDGEQYASPTERVKIELAINHLRQIFTKI